MTNGHPKFLAEAQNTQKKQREDGARSRCCTREHDRLLTLATAVEKVGTRIIASPLNVITKFNGGTCKNFGDQSRFMSIIKEQFTISASRFSQDSILIDLLWREIESKYNSGSRNYHTLDHLDHVTKMLLPFREAFSHWHVIIFAIAYHDVVYKPIRNDNEERSSRFAADALKRLGVDDGNIGRCQELIMATKAHKPADDETNLFTDADLSILGSDPSSYQQYSENVRKEYSIFPDLIYIPGRKKVLNHFLSMDAIFKTPEFRGSLEQQARINLQRELQSY